MYLFQTLFWECVMAYLTQYSSSIPVIKFHIDQTLMTIGQHIDMDICVPEEGIAENHAAVEAIKQLESYRYIIKSQEDESLFELNGETVSHAELQDGDWLLIGGVEFQFTDDGSCDIKENLNTNPDMPVTTKIKSDPANLATLTLEKPAEKHELSALELVKELKEEVESITSENPVEDGHFSRRLRFF